MDVFHPIPRLTHEAAGPSNLLRGIHQRGDSWVADILENDVVHPIDCLWRDSPSKWALLGIRTNAARVLPLVGPPEVVDLTDVHGMRVATQYQRQVVGAGEVRRQNRDNRAFHGIHQTPLVQHWKC